MLYPVELRAPEREAINLRTKKRASNPAPTRFSYSICPTKIYSGATRCAQGANEIPPSINERLHSCRVSQRPTARMQWIGDTPPGSANGLKIVQRRATTFVATQVVSFTMRQAIFSRCGIFFDMRASKRRNSGMHICSKMYPPSV